MECLRPVSGKAALIVALALSLFLGLAPILAGAASAKARIKDIAVFAGARRNQLIGYGIVVGLNGTGDQKLPVTTQSATAMLKNLGVNMPPGAVKLKNVASVIVTADLPPFARTGGTIDVTVSSIGDATSLQGGILVLTQLSAVNGEVYALAQGSVVVGTGGSLGKSSAHRTIGLIPGGATVEREVPVTLVNAETKSVDILLANPDFATASSVVKAINERFGAGTASAVSAGDVRIPVKDDWKDLVSIISEIEGLTVDVDSVAKVIVNERTGTVVMGGNVRIMPASVAFGNLSVRVADPSAKDAKAQDNTAATTVSVASVDKEGSVDDLVRLLHSMGATPRDIVGILVALKESGALLAELQTM